MVFLDIGYKQTLNKKGNVMEGQIADTAAQLTLWGLFMRADIVVKLVMIGLTFASIWTWAIIFYKNKLLGAVRESSDDFENHFWSGESFDALAKKIGDKANNPLEAIFLTAVNELKRSQGGQSVQNRVERAMHVTLHREMEELERHLPVLASIGSSAPFVGLFGTVWGIMNAFTAIAVSGQTSLTVVAPGIAEALFATAIGLVAAIPATLGYNKLATDLDRLYGRAETFAGDLTGVISRQIDNDK